MLISQVPVNRGCWVTFSANIQPTDHTSTGVEYFKPSRSSDHQTKHEFDTQLQSISPSIFLIPYSSFLILIITGTFSSLFLFQSDFEDSQLQIDLLIVVDFVEIY
ncbi:unnamed protein product [Camellia sinensis]